MHIHDVDINKKSIIRVRERVREKQNVSSIIIFPFCFPVFDLTKQIR